MHPDQSRTPQYGVALSWYKFVSLQLEDISKGLKSLIVLYMLFNYYTVLNKDNFTKFIFYS